MSFWKKKKIFSDFEVILIAKNIIQALNNYRDPINFSEIRPSNIKLGKNVYELC